MIEMACPRPIRPSEVATIESDDGRMVASICKRTDGLFCFYVDTLEHVEESEADFWQYGMLEDGVYGAIEDVARQARARYVDLSIERSAD